MPAAYPARKLLGCKWISIFPGNPSLGLPTASGLMVVNDGESGLPRAVMAAGALTAARTAAVTGACVAALAPAGSPVSFTGAGVQARSHPRVPAALGHRDVAVYARREAARRELDPSWVAPDAIVLPLDYASSVGPSLARQATLTADHLPQFETARATGALGDYPAATRWTGELLEGPRPDRRVVCQNLGNGLSDLVVAAAVADAAEARGLGQVLDTGAA